MCVCVWRHRGMPLKFRVIAKLSLELPSGKIAIFNVFYTTHAMVHAITAASITMLIVTMLMELNEL